MQTSTQEELRWAVVMFKEDVAEGLTRQALASGLSPQDIMGGSLILGLEDVGRLYAAGEYFLPELVMVGNTAKRIMDVLQPLIDDQEGSRRPGRVVIGTVAGDLHDIGKSMVITVLKGAGYEVIDLGIDVPTSAFVAAVRDHRPRLLGMSALLLTTREMMRKVIDALVEAGLRDEVKIIVGGCSVSQGYADAIGADGYGKDAISAVRLARELLA